MPQTATKYFDFLDYDADSLLEFPAGIPGFEEETRFVLVERDDLRPLVFMQSLSNPQLCFVALPVQAVKPDYHLYLSEEEAGVLGLHTGSRPIIGVHVLCLALITVNSTEPPTANLLAPVVVNLQNRKAVQAVQMDSVYSHRHALLAEAAC